METDKKELEGFINKMFKWGFRAYVAYVGIVFAVFCLAFYVFFHFMCKFW